MEKLKLVDDANELADSIIKISDGISELRRSRLTDRALMVLLRDASKGVKKSDIEKVLDGLEDMRDLYVKADKVVDKRQKESLD